MTRDAPFEVDVEEGEISDDSVEEISAEDFKQDSSRVWMGDVLQFPISAGNHYVSNLYNFAWAQAVQNKPLYEKAVPRPVVASEERISGKEQTVDGGEDSNPVMEKEEGELEEGEIEFGSWDAVVGDYAASDHPGKGEQLLEEKKEQPKNEPGVLVEVELKEEEEDGEPEMEVEEMEDFDERVSSILEDLEAVTVEDSEKCFEGACSRLQKALESMQKMVSESHTPVLEALVQQAFTGIQAVHTVFLKSKEQNKNVLSRLLVHIRSLDPALFTPEQMDEINMMTAHSLVSEAVNKEREGKACLKQTSDRFDSNTNEKDHPAFAKLPKLEPLSTKKSRVNFSLLLDPHVNHDEGSLPSPTRANMPPSFIQRPVGIGSGATESACTVNKQEGKRAPTRHSYVTDALKAVSSYQQKYGHTSVLPYNRLPSPTPSEECKDDDDKDLHEEVSSSSALYSVREVNSRFPFQSKVSTSGGANYVSSSGQGIVSGELGYGSKPNPVAKTSAKSRDPRLRFANPEFGSFVDHTAPKNGHIGGVTVNARKHKVVDKPVSDNQNLKRQKNGFLDSRDMQMSTARGGWLEDYTSVATQPRDRNPSLENMNVGKARTGVDGIGSNRSLDSDINFKGSIGGYTQYQATNTTPVVSLPSLLQDIAVNPNLLMNLIKEQQRLTAEAQQNPVKLARDLTNRLPSIVSSVSNTSMKVSGTEQKPEEKPQMPAQIVNDAVKLRMKPRDPRRVLHSNVVQKSESCSSDQLKANGISSSNIQSCKNCMTSQGLGEQAQTAGLSLQSTPSPDISGLFTKNLKNLADIMSGSQLTNISAAVPKNISQPGPSNTDNMDVAVSDSNDRQDNISLLTHGGGSAGVSQLPNLWGDVDHLLDGYDDQQKAAIQRERARRIEEQNKMFTNRKLCLVLDLDHTLLNSAKFVEVDAVHDEILRKKEEQDREKPDRHLFRFQHMGMWTKLRPGIWNFLDKASKLYELHLYTMGNKLYATEMAKVLDPTGALFAGRVISKGDDGDPFDGDERVPKSKDLDGVLGMESAVVVIDDSVRVWPHHKLNLIVVERYTYFPCSRRQFGLLGPSLLEIDHDERPEDGTLASSLAVIERIHFEFFAHDSLNDVDVRNILASQQHRILSGCRIVFSRIIPVGEANPHLHPLWQTAEQFGATCTNQIDDRVTHVVANSLGTDKVNWALSTGRFVVHPGWVEASALLYRRASEHDFAVKAPTSTLLNPGAMAT